MADFDPKDLPILDDVIEIEDNIEINDVETGTEEILDVSTSPDIGSLDDIEADTIVSDGTANDDTTTDEITSDNTAADKTEPSITELDNTAEAEEAALFTAEPVVDFSEEEDEEEKACAETDISTTASPDNDAIAEDIVIDDDIEFESAQQADETETSPLPLATASNEVENEGNSEFESALIEYEPEESLVDDAATDAKIEVEVDIPNEAANQTEEFAPNNAQILDCPATDIPPPVAVIGAELQATISDEIIEQLMPELEQRIRDVVQQVLKEKL